MTKIQYFGLKKSETNILPLGKNSLKNLNFINFMNVPEQSNQIEMDNYNYINLPVPGKKHRYIFGDFVSFVKKVNKLHRLILIKRSLNITAYKFDKEIKNNYKSLQKNKIYNFNFAKHIYNIFSEVNFNFNYYERNYQGKINIFKLCLLTKKYILLVIINKILFYIKTKNKKAIVIQSHIRRIIFNKKFNAYKNEINYKALIIQKYLRGFHIRNIFKDKILYIVDNINFNKRQKEYERKVKIMIKKREAIRVIESWWEKILEERKQKELEEKIKKMPKDCQKLYRQFVKLRKQTKSIKIEFNEFAKDKIGFVP